MFRLSEKICLLVALIRRQIQNAFSNRRNKKLFSSQPCANIQTNSLIVTRLLEERIDCETKMTSHFDVK